MRDEIEVIKEGQKITPLEELMLEIMMLETWNIMRRRKRRMKRRRRKKKKRRKRKNERRRRRKRTRRW